jgi:ribosome-associated protein
VIGPEHFRREVIFRAVRSRGPGGQNVNKVSSAAQINWDLEHSLLFTPEQKERLRLKLAPLMTNEGYIQFRADEFRDLERNKQRCLEKLAELVRSALFVPKKRKATKPTRSSQKKRIEQKSRRGEIKKLRRKLRE